MQYIKCRVVLSSALHHKRLSAFVPVVQALLVLLNPVIFCKQLKKAGVETEHGKRVVEKEVIN